VTANLPIFGDTRAAIQIQKATRSELRAEYQARLDAATADAWRVWQETQLLRRQIALLEEKLPAFRQIAEVTARAHGNGDLSPATYVLMQTSLQARESELLDLKMALWNDTLALNTLLVVPLVPVADGTAPTGLSR
jgi:outer membrane protein TolC